jgi:hypothetical protein
MPIQTGLPERLAWIDDANRSEHSFLTTEDRCAFVPIPTSKQPGHPEYCDRLERSLRLAFAGYRADVRPLLRLTASTPADHLRAAARLQYQHLLAMTILDARQLAAGLRPVVVA